MSPLFLVISLFVNCALAFEVTPFTRFYAQFVNERNGEALPFNGDYNILFTL
jgi:hypothetical protein